MYCTVYVLDIMSLIGTDKENRLFLQYQYTVIQFCTESDWTYLNV